MNQLLRFTSLSGLTSSLILLASSSIAAAPAGQEVFTVRAGGSAGVITLGGTVIPRKMVKLLAQIPGDVERLAGEEGDAFKKGTALVQLDTAALLAKRKQAVAQLASAEAGYRNAVVQYRREVVSPSGQSNQMLGGMPQMFSMFSDPMRSMTGQGSPGYDRHSSLVGQDTRVQTAANSVRQARAAISELDDNLENAVSRAPFDGVIVKKMVETGDIVQPGMPLVVFADTDEMQIQVEVPSRLIRDLKQGTTVRARLDGYSHPFEVSVARIFPMAQRGGHTTTVKFGIPAEVKAQSGVYAAVSIPDRSQARASLPMIPVSAIVWRGSLPAVFMVRNDGGLSMRVLRVGAATADGQVPVTSGLQPGDQILRAPRPGTRSTPPKPAKAS